MYLYLSFDKHIKQILLIAESVTLDTMDMPRITAKL